MDQIPPSPKESHKGCLKFFQQFTEIFAAQGGPLVSLTPVANGKIFNQKVFKSLYIFTPLGSRVNIFIHIFLQVNLKIKAV
jgi:hypothetical protein